MTRFLTVFILIFILAACAPGSVVKDVPTGTPKADDVLIVVQTSGGITGKTTTWTMYGGGKITNGEGITLTASPDKVAALRDDLISAGFSTQVKDMPRIKPCPDCTQTDVTLTIDGKPVTLSIINEASETPAQARSLVEKVMTFIMDSQPKP